MTQFKYAKYIDAMTPLNSFCVKGLLREIEAGLEVAGEWLGAVGEGGCGGGGVGGGEDQKLTSLRNSTGRVLS